MLYSVAQVQRLIASGRPLLLAGSEWALSQLPRGNWIGGSICYFMGLEGGVCSETQIFVDEVPAFATGFGIRQYTGPRIVRSLVADTPAQGFALVIIPGGSPVHAIYARTAPDCEDLFSKRVVGWVSGVRVDRIGLDRPLVFNGLTGMALSEEAVAMHVSLPAGYSVEVETVSVFGPGSADTITFPRAGFSAAEATVNGQPENFPGYLLRTERDPHVPLTGRQNGRAISVSVQGFDEITGSIRFYAPVFPGVEYRFAQSVPDYVAAFNAVMEKHLAPSVFACNCILNYFYAGLEGKRTGAVTGPITFGEIAHQLLNQTLVRLLIRDASGRSPTQPPLADSVDDVSRFFG